MRYLAYGSLPGVVVGVTLLACIHSILGNAVDNFLRGTIGALLIAIPLACLLNLRRSPEATSIELMCRPELRLGIASAGFVGGVLVGLTSVGSGSVVLMILLITYGISPAQLVGTDIVHAVILSLLASALQWKLGNVDLGVLLPVLAGSIPGGLLGARFTRSIPSARLKQVLFALLIAAGTRFLWGALAHA